jgi:hypothetical protein
VRFEDIGLIFIPLFLLLLYWLLPFPEDDLPSPATSVEEPAEEARVSPPAEMTRSPRPRSASTVEAITTLVLFGLLGAFVLLLRSVGMPRRSLEPSSRRAIKRRSRCVASARVAER